MSEKNLETIEEKPAKEEKPLMDTNEETSANKKKLSPFLSSEVKNNESQSESADEDSSSIKKQYEHIDDVSKERSIFNAVGKLYFFSKKTGKPETRGSGKFLIIKDNAGMYRLMMIRDQVMLKGCDHYITPNCELKKATNVKNAWYWTALFDNSDAEVKEKETQYFAIFPDEETAVLFKKMYDQAQTDNSELIKSKKNENKVEKDGSSDKSVEKDGSSDKDESKEEK